MGVLIKDMEMPRGCYDCTLESICGRWAKHDAEWQKTNRDEDCPLASVPPHGDLIDRDELEQDAQKRLLMCNKNDNQFQRTYEVLRAVALAPTIIPADHIGDVNEMVGDS